MTCFQVPRKEAAEYMNLLLGRQPTLEMGDAVLMIKLL